MKRDVPHNATSAEKAAEKKARLREQQQMLLVHSPIDPNPITSDFDLILSTPFTAFARLISRDTYDLRFLTQPTVQRKRRLPILLERQNIADFRLSSLGTFFYLDKRRNNVIYSLRLGDQQPVEIAFEKPILYYTLSASGQFLVVLDTDFYLRVYNIHQQQRYSYQREHIINRSEALSMVFSDDEKKVYFKQFNRGTGKHGIYAWTFSAPESPVELIYELSPDNEVYKFFICDNEQLVFCCDRETITVAHRKTGRTSQYQSEHMRDFKYFPQQKYFGVVCYSRAAELLMKRGFPGSCYTVLFYSLDKTKAIDGMDLPADSEKFRFCNDSLSVLSQSQGLLSYRLNPHYFGNTPINREVSLRQFLEESTFKLLSRAYISIENLVKEKTTAEKNSNNQYFLRSPLDWLNLFGHFADQESRTGMDLNRVVLSPCTIFVGPEGRAVRIIKNSIVLFERASPDGRPVEICGGSYVAIAEYLANMLESPDNHIRPTDIISMLRGTFDRELLANHRQLAETLLLRLQGQAFPEDRYTDDQQYFLDALLVLLVLVEGSRNNFSLLSFIMLMDLIANHVSVSGKGYAYNFIQSFFAGIDWDGPFKPEKESFDRGGQHPMSSGTTGSGNLTSRREGIEAAKEPKTKKPRKLEDYKRAPQREFVVIQESQLIADWLLWFCGIDFFEVKLHEPLILNLAEARFTRRLSQIFEQNNRELVIRKDSFGHSLPAREMRPEGYIDRELKRVLYLEHCDITNNRTVILNYFHSLHAACPTVPEYVLEAKTKGQFIKTYKKNVGFTARACIADIENMGLERSLNPPLSGGYYEHRFGVVNVIDDRNITLNNFLITINAEERRFLLSYLADYFEWYLNYIDQRMMRKYLSLALQKTFRDLGIRGLLKPFMDHLLPNLRWEKKEPYKDRVYIYKRSIVECCRLFTAIEDQGLSEIYRNNTAIIVKVILDSLLQVTFLKSKTVHSTDLRWSLFNPKLNPFDPGSEELDRIGDDIRVLELEGKPYRFKCKENELKYLRDNSLIAKLIVIFTEGILDSFQNIFELRNDKKLLALNPCPECFGAVHHAASIPIFKYGTPCLIETEKNQFHSFDSDCECSLTDSSQTRAGHVSESLFEQKCTPCDRCWQNFRDRLETTSQPVNVQSLSTHSQTQKLQQSQTGFFGSRSAPAPLPERDGKKINQLYWYEDDEIVGLLKMRIAQQQNRTSKGIPIFVYGPVDNLSPYGLRQILLNHSRRPGHVLIPFNIGRSHWVGLSLLYDQDGKLIRARYYDSVRGHGIPPLLNQILKGFFSPGDLDRFEEITQDIIRQDNGSDCGPSMIGNLLRSVGIDDGAGDDQIQRRLVHLQWLEQGENQERYQRFYQRQRDNQPSFDTNDSLKVFVADKKILDEAVKLFEQIPPDCLKQLTNQLNPKNRDEIDEHRFQITMLKQLFSHWLETPEMIEQALLTEIISKFFYAHDVIDSREKLEEARLIFDYNHLEYLFVTLNKILINPDLVRNHIH